MIDSRRWPSVTGPSASSPGVVGPAMPQRVGHRRDEVGRRVETVLEVDATGDPAHYERPETMPRRVTIEL